VTPKRESFAAFLRAAMENAGLPTAQDLSDATNGVVKRNTIYRWLRAEYQGGEGELSNRLLRATADALGVPVLHMYVAAGQLSASEAGLVEDPTPPPPPRSTEEAIAADPRLTRQGKETLLYLAERFAREREEEAENSRGRSGT